MPTETFRRPDGPFTNGLNDVLAHLTTAHAEMLERYGPLMGMGGVKRPTEAVTFAGEQTRLAAIQDAEPNPERSVALMMEREARAHEQIGRLASFIAGYELAHGDPGNVEAMEQLGGDHFDLAGKIRTHLNETTPSSERVDVGDTLDRMIPAFYDAPRADELDAAMAPDIFEQLRARRANQNDRDPGRSL